VAFVSFKNFASHAAWRGFCAFSWDAFRRLPRPPGTPPGRLHASWTSPAGFFRYCLGSFLCRLWDIFEGVAATTEQTDTQTDRQADRQTDRENGQTDRQTDRQTNRQTERTDRQTTDRQRDRQTERDTRNTTNRENEPSTNTKIPNKKPYIKKIATPD